MAVQIAFALYPLCLAGLALVWVARIRPPSRAVWLVEAAAAASVTAFAFLAGPWAFTSYEIFGDAVYSPCEGTILARHDGQEDRPPGEAAPADGSGNHVIVKCDGVEILLAHLRRASVLVSAGEAVRLGQAIGKVGNSGYSMEPHLHIGAKRGGREAGLLFDGRQLSVNSRVIGFPR